MGRRAIGISVAVAVVLIGAASLVWRGRSPSEQVSIITSVSPQFCVADIEDSEANKECVEVDRVVSEVGEIHPGDGVAIIEDGATWRVVKRFDGVFTLGS